MITAAGSATSYGAWGKHGFAAVELGAASLEQSLVSGRMNSVLAYVIGRRTATNPAGVGGARWQGPVEAASTRTFLRYEGKATLTIPDLAKPRIGAAIEVAGSDISEPGWKDMPLAQGRFTSGTAGQDDYLEGNLHGPNHEEAYGVFDTGAYVGAFRGQAAVGAAREGEPQDDGARDRQTQDSGRVSGMALTAFRRRQDAVLCFPDEAPPESAVLPAEPGSVAGRACLDEPGGSGAVNDGRG